MRISGLVKRGEVFYFRRRVPISLLEYAPKPVLIRSMNTKAYVFAIKKHAQLTLELEHIFGVIAGMSKLDPDFTKAYFHQLLQKWMGLDGSVPTPPADITLIEDRMKDNDNDLRDIGADHLMISEQLRQRISYADIGDIEKIGSLLLRATLEHAKQMQAQQSGRFDGIAIDPYFKDAITHSGGEQVEQAQFQMPPVVANPSSVLHPAQSPALIADLKTSFDAFMREAKYGEKRTYRFNRIFSIVTELFGSHFLIHDIRGGRGISDQ